MGLSEIQKRFYGFLEIVTLLYLILEIDIKMNYK
jgi:hypothetical protein